MTSCRHCPTAMGCFDCDRSIGGDAGTLYWFAGHDNLAALESQMLESMQNEETNKLLAEANELFQASPQEKIIMTM